MGVVLKAQVDNLTGRNEELRRELHEVRFEAVKAQENFNKANCKACLLITSCQNVLFQSGNSVLHLLYYDIQLCRKNRSTCSIRRCCFDIFAGVDAALGMCPYWSVALSMILRRLSSSVSPHGGPAGGFTRAGQATTSCRLQSYYSSTVTLHGGPVGLRSELVRIMIWYYASC